MNKSVIFSYHNSMTFDFVESTFSKYSSITKINFKISSFIKSLFKYKKFYFLSPKKNLILCLLILKLFNKRIITGIHDFEAHDGESKLLVHAYNFFNILFSNKVIYFSQNQIQLAKKKYSIFKYKFYYLPLYFDYECVEKYLKNSFNKDIDILFLGRIRDYKDIEIFNKLAIYDLNIFIAGSSKKTSKIKFNKKINFVNKWISNHYYFELLCRSRYLLLPYKSATQSGPLIDAYHSKTNCIISNIKELNEQKKIFGNCIIYKKTSDILKILDRKITIKYKRFDIEKYKMLLSYITK